MHLQLSQSNLPGKDRTAWFKHKTESCPLRQITQSILNQFLQ